jgi:type I restriction enzyme, S subunit
MGKIPKEWIVTNFGELCQYQKGKKPSKVENEKSKGFLPYLSTQYLRENGSHNFAEISKDVVTVNEGDLVLLWDGSNAGEFFQGKEGILSSTMVRILQKNELFKTRFLFYLLKTRESFIKGQTKGTGIPHVDGNVLDRVVLPVPKPTEQEKIVEVLGIVDSALELADRVIAKTKRLKRGLMQQLLTHGIGHTETKSTPIGIMPKEWQAIQLKDVVLSYKNGIYKPSQYAGKGRPCVRMYNIVAGQINLVNAALLDVTNQELEEFGLEQGDIVVNRVNTSELVGKAGVVPASFGKVTFESKNIRVRLDIKQILPEFLSVFVQTKAYSNQLLSKAKTAVAQATITQVDLDAIIIPLPPTIDEQEEVVRIISTVDKKLQLEKEERVKVDKIKHGLMDLLLTGKVRIKVN